MESFEYTGLIFKHSHFILWYNVMIVDIKIYNKVIYNLHVLDSLFLSPLSNCLLKVMIIVSPLFIMNPPCHLLPCGPWNLTMNSLSPPRIVTSCLLSILIQVKDAKIHCFFINNMKNKSFTYNMYHHTIHLKLQMILYIYYQLF